MPLDPAKARECPFLLESDHLTLSRNFRLSKHGLRDQALKISHNLEPRGREVLKYLSKGCTFNALLGYAKQSGVTIAQLLELLGFLNMVGAFSIKRSFFKKAQAHAQQFYQRPFGVRYQPLTWRGALSATAIMHGLSRACMPLAICLAITDCLLLGVGLWPTPTMLSFSWCGFLVFFVSQILHELSHVWVINRSGAPAVALQKGRRFGVLHPTLPPKIEIASALSGPLVGFLTCMVAAGAAALYSLPLAWILGVVGVFHLCSLLPWYGDGVSLLRALNEQKGTHAVTSQNL